MLNFMQFLLAKDGHLSYKPALITSVFLFRTNIKLVSLSTDGQELPKIYLVEEAEAFARGKIANISDIISINNHTAVDFVEKAAAFSEFQDPDALYQSMFFSTGGFAAGSGSNFGALHFPGLPDTLELRFSNGTVYTVNTEAVVKLNFRHIDSGKDVRSAVEIPSRSTATTTTTGAVFVSFETATSTSAATAVPTIDGYPSPVVIDSGETISGYFLNGTENNDTAVLAVAAFEVSSGNTTLGALEFRSVLAEFLAECQAAGKTKLVVDLQGNRGGLVLLGLELFKQLFPLIDLYQPSTTRATPFLDSILTTDVDTKFAIGDVVDANGNDFDTWDAVFGPQVLVNDNLTTTFQYNYSDYTANEMSFAPAGYGTDESIPDSPFTAENIVIITDGQCSSTCTIFTGMATRVAGVRTIAYGGRPQNLPMQAVGGVKGNQNMPWLEISELAYDVREANNGSIPAYYAGPQSTFPSTKDAPLNPNLNDETYKPSLNYRNAHRSFNETTPLQFVYEAASCRQFFTLDTWTNIAALWESAANIAWHGGKCVSGSTTNNDNTIGNTTLPYTSAVKAGSNFEMPGPGALSTASESTQANGVNAASSTSSSGVKTAGAVETRVICSTLGSFVGIVAAALVLF